MTEQQIKRIQEAVTPNVAIYCADAEEREMLFDAKQWRKDGKYSACIEKYPTDCCFNLNPGNDYGYEWGYCTKSWYEKKGKTIIPLSALLSPKSSGLVEALGLELERKYQYNQTVFWFTEKQFHVETGGSFGIGSVALLIEIFNNPHEIHPVRVWGEETVEDAKAAMRLGFKKVERECNRFKLINLHHLDPKDEWETLNGKQSEQLFKDVQPGECVALADIAGG